MESFENNFQYLGELVDKFLMYFLFVQLLRLQGGVQFQYNLGLHDSRVVSPSDTAHSLEWSPLQDDISSTYSWQFPQPCCEQLKRNLPLTLSKPQTEMSNWLLTGLSPHRMVVFIFSLTIMVMLHQRIVPDCSQSFLELYRSQSVMIDRNRMIIIPPKYQ